MDALDDTAEAEPIPLHNLKTVRLDLSERSSRHAISVDADGEQLDEFLDSVDRPVRAPDVIDQNQVASGPQDALHFGHRSLYVGNVAEREGAYD
jgi:hypothetical protein